MHSKSTSRLCGSCQAIFSTPVARKAQLKGPHHPNLASLEEAVAADCYCCVRVRRAIQRHDPGFGRSSNLLRLPYWISIDREGFTLNLDIYTDNASFRVKFWGVEASEVSKSGAIDRLTTTTRSSQSFQQASQWIVDCQQNHTSCRQTASTISLPTRLILVEPKEDELGLRARLCLGESMPTETAYLTLSHAWGSQKFITLTKENLPQFCKSIPVTTLSRTFQDALYSTHQLGFQYLWIDSLCIIQDDKDDWDRESKQMGDVYKNAVCNLVGSAFQSGEEGFLMDQRLSDPTPATIQVNWFDGMNLRLGHFHDKTFALIEPAPWHEIWNGHLFQRAWVLQEQILARRALHFGRDQIFWECNELFATEVWPEGWHPRNEANSDNRFQRELQSDLQRKPFWHFSMEDHGYAKTFDTWKKVVEDYSTRQITFSSDRLPALAGIASVFEKLLAFDKYMFGMWKSDLNFSLLWNEGGPFPRPNTRFKPSWDQYPSWSWVSLGQPVHWHSDFFPEDHKTHINTLSTILAPEDTLSAYALRITGNLMRLPPERKLAYELREIIPECCFLIIQDRESTFYYSFDQWYFDQSLNDTDDNESRSRSLITSVHFMPMTGPDWGKHAAATGLLLWRDSSMGKGYYRRVGTAYMRPDLGKVVQSSQNSFKDFAWYHQWAIEPEDYLQHNDFQIYSVALV